MSLWRRIFAERRGVALPLAVLLVGNVAVFALGVLPLIRSVSSHKEASLKAKADLGEALRQDKIAKGALSSKDQAELELAKFYAEILPRSHASGVELINSWLHRTAQESGVQLESGQIDPERVRDSNLVRLKSVITLKGQYANIRRYLYAVETAEEFVIIEKVKVTDPGATATGGALDLQLNVTTYFIAPEGSQAP